MFDLITFKVYPGLFRVALRCHSGNRALFFCLALKKSSAVFRLKGLVCGVHVDLVCFLCVFLCCFSIYIFVIPLHKEKERQFWDGDE